MVGGARRVPADRSKRAAPASRSRSRYVIASTASGAPAALTASPPSSGARISRRRAWRGATRARRTADIPSRSTSAPIAAPPSIGCRSASPMSSRSRSGRSPIRLFRPPPRPRSPSAATHGLPSPAQRPAPPRRRRRGGRVNPCQPLVIRFAASGAHIRCTTPQRRITRWPASPEPRLRKWQGTGKEGKGTLATQSGTLADTPYGFNTRFGGDKGTNPED